MPCTLNDTVVAVVVVVAAAVVVVVVVLTFTRRHKAVRGHRTGPKNCYSNVHQGSKIGQDVLLILKQIKSSHQSREYTDYSTTVQLVQQYS